MAIAELGGELIAPIITIDSRIAITPKNVSNKHIQDFMVDRGAILRVTEDGRVGLQTPRGVSLLGFDDFLFRREVDVNNPHALDKAPQVQVMSSDPLTLAKRRYLRELQKAVRRWELPKESAAIRPPPKIDVMVDDKKDQGTQAPKYRAIFLTLFNIFKQTAAMFNRYIIEPIRRSMYNVYDKGMHPLINWMFGQIGHKDEYDQTEKDMRMLLSQPKNAQTVIEEPVEPLQPNQRMVWRHGKDKPILGHAGQDALTTGTKITVSMPFTNKLRVT